MKREEKNALSRQRILEAALHEFSVRGYEAASLNTICAENDISKGIIYHYYKDKGELYLLCVAECFDKLTAWLEKSRENSGGSIDEQLRSYFDARLRFFMENPVYLGIFLNVALNPPEQLSSEIAAARSRFDRLNVSTLTALLESTPLRKNVSVEEVVDDFRMYMDYFNARFQTVLSKYESPEQALKKHEERCHRQLETLLYGVLVRDNE